MSQAKIKWNSNDVVEQASEMRVEVTASETQEILRRVLHYQGKVTLDVLRCFIDEVLSDKEN